RRGGTSCASCGHPPALAPRRLRAVLLRPVLLLFFLLPRRLLLRRTAARGHPGRRGEAADEAERDARERGLGHEPLDEEQDDGEAERPHVLLVERDLDALGELLAHHLLEAAGDLVDSRLALLGADDRAAGHL